MAKRPRTMKFRIPPYKTPRNAWREAIYQAAKAARKKSDVAYEATDLLQLDVLVYMDEGELSFHDVDNRLKDIMDALQGRIGGAKAARNHQPIVPNDSQFYRVTVEKRLTAPQSLKMGHVHIKKMARLKQIGKRNA